MNRFFLLVATFALAVSCSRDAEMFASSENEIIFSLHQESTRVVDNQFQSGDQISVSAYDGDKFFDNGVYAYNQGEGLFKSSSSPIVKADASSELSYRATYPVINNLGGDFTFSVAADQNSASAYSKSDLLVAQVAATTADVPELSFSHKMVSIVVNVEGASNHSDLDILAKSSATCNIVDDSFVGSGTTSTISAYDMGSNSYKVVVAPQNVAKGTKFASIEIGDKDYVWLATDMDLKSGKEYTFVWNVSEETITYKGEPAGSSSVVPTGPVTDTSAKYSGWAELPGERVKSGDYYYAYHTTPLGSKTVRNFGACYSKKFMSPVWVAGPMHRCYRGGASRTNAYRDDPQIPFGQVETLGSPYNRGHMIASSDRIATTAMNKQAFYLTNIAPQLINYFNSGGGIWNNYEDWIQGEYQSRQDTLYIVNGCNWENTNKVVKGTTVPTHYYKALLRMKEKNNTSKAVWNCSSDELECVAFYFEHKSSQSKPSASHMISIEKLEELTGWTFFPNVPNAPKGKYTASDWL